MDLYRLADSTDLGALNLREVLKDSVCLLEWPDRLGAYTPADRLDVDIRLAQAADSNLRMLKLYPRSHRWVKKLESGGLGN